MSTCTNEMVKMAAKDIEHLKRHFLTCDICMEIFEDPVTLTCGHTFCRKCYIRYCQENKESTRRKTIQCPTCKQSSDVKNPGQMVDGSWNVADWVKPLKPTFMVRGLLDDFVVGESIGDRRKSSRKEPVLNRDICPKHKLHINYYCKKCKMSVCSDCGLQNHNKCGDIVQIESLKPELKSTLNNNLETLTHQMKTVERQMENLRRMESKVREDITSNCESAVKLIREWERKTLDELSSVTEQHFEQLRAQLKSAEIDLQIFIQYSELISCSLRDENEIDMIDMYEMCKTGEILNKRQSGGQVSSTNDVTEIQLERCFSPDEIKKNCHLGNLIVKKVKSDIIEVMTRRNSQTLTTSLLDTIDMRVTGDTDTPELADICVVEVGGVEVVVAAVYFNSCLRSYHVKNNTPRVTSLQLRDEPLKVTRLSSNQVAVSLYNVNKIVLVKVTPNLTIQSTITTQREYSGLTSLDENTLAAGCYSPPCVDILDLRGRVKKTITPCGSLIQYPNYLSTTQEGNILVTGDWSSKSVVCLTPGGDVVFTYTPTGDRALGESQCTTTTTTGDILVADSCNNKVIQLTGAGEYVRDLLTSQDNIYCPRGVCVNRDKLYVAQWDKPLNVFRLN